MPGSGTSCVAEVYARAGFFGGAPYFSKGGYGYETHESMLGRAVNRIVLGGTQRDWPSWRWHDDYRPRNPYSDPEVFAFGAWFINWMDAHGADWFFKNPESLLTWNGFWDRFRFDRVVGVYRHPEESIRTLHSTQKACYRRGVWNRYSRRMLQAAHHTIRFPDDVAALAESMDVESPLRKEIIKTNHNGDPSRLRWCATRWKELEEARWLSTTETAT
jgi:hypothetical protein